jgi:AcrR family transcriptional regulator
MRVTAQAMQSTRRSLIRAARGLFVKKGWEYTTTRRIAKTAGVAAGTLFNYFDSKEAIAAELISEALQHAQEVVETRLRRGETVEEELFSLIWTELANLREYRKFLPAAAETIFSPLRRITSGSPGESLRRNHLEAVDRVIARHGGALPLTDVTLQLYWTLYLGVFAHWATDDSPHQEDSLAVLDQSLKLFVPLLNRPSERKKKRESHTQRTHRRPASR